MAKAYEEFLTPENRAYQEFLVNSDDPEQLEENLDKGTQGVTRYERFAVQNLSPSPESAVKWLKSRGYDAKLYGGKDEYKIAVRKPGEDIYKVVDPEGADLSDVTDIIGDLGVGAVSGAGALLGGGTTLGLGTAAGGAGGAIVGEGARRGLGGLAGFEQEDLGETAKDMAIEGAFGAASPYLGHYAGKLAGKVLPKVGRTLQVPGRAPAALFERVAGGKGLSAMKREAKKELLDLLTNPANKALKDKMIARLPGEVITEAEDILRRPFVSWSDIKNVTGKIAPTLWDIGDEGAERTARHLDELVSIVDESTNPRFAAEGARERILQEMASPKVVTSAEEAATRTVKGKPIAGVTDTFKQGVKGKATLTDQPGKVAERLLRRAKPLKMGELRELRKMLDDPRLVSEGARNSVDNALTALERAIEAAGEADIAKQFLKSPGFKSEVKAIKELLSQSSKSQGRTEYLKNVNKAIGRINQLVDDAGEVLGRGLGKPSVPGIPDKVTRMSSKLTETLRKTMEPEGFTVPFIGKLSTPTLRGAPAALATGSALGLPLGAAGGIGAGLTGMTISGKVLEALGKAITKHPQIAAKIGQMITEPSAQAVWNEIWKDPSTAPARLAAATRIPAIAEALQNWANSVPGQVAPVQ